MTIKAVLEDLRSGEVQVCDLPGPEVRPGGLLVETHFSAISAGTERAKVEAGRQSLLGKALARPDLVRQVIDFARDQGIRAAYHKVQNRLDTLSALGYSCAGVVREVGPGVSDFKPGDRVAGAGVGYANHSELNFIPRNLVVPVPDAVELAPASLVAIGAIAMHGLRQSRTTLGESVVVIGAGLVGVLTVQLARAAGLRVIAIDREEHRARRAREFGAHLALCTSDPGLKNKVREFARHGVDAALITAAAPSAEPLELATSLLRDRGTVVIVGDVRIDIPRRELYEKELSLVLSRSYGPGRYDADYEEHGVDYPIGYVRWTEGRNMEAFIAALAAGDVDPTGLIAEQVPLAAAAQAYARLKDPATYTVLLKYPAAERTLPAQPQPPILQPRLAAVPKSTIRIGCIGAGGFARDVILPVLRDAPGVSLQGIATSSGSTAESARRAFGFQSAVAPSELVSSPDVDLVFVISRHDSHADYARRALQQGKGVFVEKPLAVTPEQLQSVREVVEQRQAAAERSFVMVGFNRRFAPFTTELCRFFAGRSEPMALNLRINAGYLPPEHWTQKEQGGGRIVGEFCHFVDWARAVVARPIRDVRAAALSNASRYRDDNFGVILTFDDGSVANLMYLANGDKSVPKEHYEVFCEGAIARIDDFRELQLARAGKLRRRRARQDKGHREELTRTLEAFRKGDSAPIPFAELVEVHEIVLRIQEEIVGAPPFAAESRVVGR